MVKVKGFIAVKERVGVFVCFVKMRTKIKKIVSKHCFFLPPHMAHRMGEHSSWSSERQRIFHTPDYNDIHFTNRRTWAVMWDSKIQIRDRDQVKGHDSSQTTECCRLLFTTMIFSVTVLATVAYCEAAEKQLSSPHYILQARSSKLTQKAPTSPSQGSKDLKLKTTSSNSALTN